MPDPSVLTAHSGYLKLPSPILILCLGNEIISDDAFGPAVAEELRAHDLGSDVEVVFAPVAGFALLDLLKDRARVLIVDTIRTGKAEAGTLTLFSAGVFTPSKQLTTSHQISLPTALELGRQLGIALPRTVDVLAVEAEDLETIREELTPRVQRAVPQAVALVREWIANHQTRE